MGRKGPLRAVWSPPRRGQGHLPLGQAVFPRHPRRAEVCAALFLASGRQGLLEALAQNTFPLRFGFCFSPEVDSVSGKVFFSTEAEPGELRKLKSGERVFLLLKKHTPIPVSRNKGMILTPSLGPSPPVCSRGVCTNVKAQFKSHS